MENEIQYVRRVDERNGESILSFLHLLKKNWKIVFAIFSICIVFAIVYIAVSMPVYKTSTIVMVKDPKKGGNIQSEMSLFSDFGISTNVAIDNEVDVITSITMLKRVINATHINKEFYGIRLFRKKDLFGDSPILFYDSLFNNASQKCTYTFNLKINEGGKIHLKMGKGADEFFIDSTYNDFPIEVITDEGPLVLYCAQPEHINDFDEYELKICPTNAIAGFFKANLSALPANRNSSLIQLTLFTTCRERGELFLNELINQYNLSVVEEKNEISKQTDDFINERLKFLTRELDSTEKDLEKYKKREGLMNLNANAQNYLNQSQEYDQKKVEIETQLNLVKYLIKSLSDKDAMGKVIPSNIGLSDVALISQISKYNETILSRKKLMSSTSADNPVLVLQTTQMKSLFENIQSILKATEEGLLITKTDIEKQDERYRSLIHNVPEQERMTVNIERQRFIQQEIFILLLKKREENALALAANVKNAKVVEECVTTPQPIEPKRSLVLAVALVIATVISTIFVLIKKIRRRTVEDDSEFSRCDLTYIPVWCTIPSLKNDTEKKMSEEFRRLRTYATNYLQNKKGKVMLVTSSSNGDGKSFISQRLAVSMSSMNDKVLLLSNDCSLQIKDEKKIVSNDVKLNIKVSSVDNVDILLYSAIDGKSKDVLSSEDFVKVLSDLQREYDYILFDAESMTSSSDTYILNSLSDLTLFVFRLQHTDKNIFKKINKEVETMQLKDVKVVLNS